MNYELHWKKMADRQQEQNVQRAKEEQQFKEKTKRAYMNELSTQLRENEEKRRKDKQRQKQYDRNIISQGI